MSYQQCIFGIATRRMPAHKVLGLVAECMADLAGQGLRIPATYVLLDGEARAKRAGVRMFAIGVRERGDRVLTRTPLFEYLYSVADDARVLTLLHDDQRGVYAFDLYDSDLPSNVGLLSDGCYLGGSTRVLTVDYPQKGFTHAALRALHKKPPEKLREREAAAIMQYANAATLGLRQFFPKWTGSYLDLLTSDTAWLVHDPRNHHREPEEVDRPRGWRNFIAPWPEPDDWSAAGLDPRE